MLLLPTLHPVIASKYFKYIINKNVNQYKNRHLYVYIFRHGLITFFWFVSFILSMRMHDNIDSINQQFRLDD